MSLAGMKRSTRCVMIILPFCLLVLPLIGFAQSPLVISDVAIVDVATGSTEPGQTVVIEGEHIAAVGTTAEIVPPEVARVVDGRGRYLIPGLWDMHVHSVTNRDWHFPMLLVHGVTGVRNMHSTEADPLARVQAVKAQLASGDLLGPRFIANGPIVDGPPGIWPSSVLVDSPEEAADAVERLAAGGADFIKIYDNLSTDTFRALMARANTLGIPVDGHLPREVQPRDAAEAGMRTIEHGSGITMGCSTEAEAARAGFAEHREKDLSFIESRMAVLKLLRLMNDTQDDERCAEVAEAYRRHGVAATPTLVTTQSDSMVSHMLADETVVAMMPAERVARWRGMTQSEAAGQFAELAGPLLDGAIDRTQLLHDGDVILLAGTDIGNPLIAPGYSLHQELKLLVEAGLTPHEALQTATINPAKVLGMADRLGQVRPGFAADLVILRKNPLDDIEHARAIEAVITRGRLLDRATLDEMSNAGRQNGTGGQE